MEKNGNNDEMHVLQVFAKYMRDNISSLDRNFHNVHNPIFLALSKQLKLPKDKIRKIILRTQPFLILTNCG